MKWCTECRLAYGIAINSGFANNWTDAVPRAVAAPTELREFIH